MYLDVVTWGLENVSVGIGVSAVLVCGDLCFSQGFLQKRFIHQSSLQFRSKVVPSHQIIVLNYNGLLCYSSGFFLCLSNMHCLAWIASWSCSGLCHGTAPVLIIFLTLWCSGFICDFHSCLFFGVRSAQVTSHAVIPPPLCGLLWINDLTSASALTAHKLCSQSWVNTLIPAYSTKAGLNMLKLL